MNRGGAARQVLRRDFHSNSLSLSLSLCQLLPYDYHSYSVVDNKFAYKVCAEAYARGGDGGLAPNGCMIVYNYHYYMF